MLRVLSLIACFRSFVLVDLFDYKTKKKRLSPAAFSVCFYSFFFAIDVRFRGGRDDTFFCSIPHPTADQRI